MVALVIKTAFLFSESLPKRYLSEDVLDEVGGFGDTWEGLIQPLEWEGELVVFHAHEVKDSGLKILGGNWIGDRFVADGVGFAVGVAAFDAGARHPHGVAARVMVAAASLNVVVAATVFFHWCSAKFRAPDQQGVFEQASLFEVGDEGVNGAALELVGTQAGERFVGV